MSTQSTLTFVASTELGRREIAWEVASRLLYGAERRGGRGVGLARYRERRAWEALCAAKMAAGAR